MFSWRPMRGTVLGALVAFSVLAHRPVRDGQAQPRPGRVPAGLIGTLPQLAYREYFRYQLKGAAMGIQGMQQ